MPKQSLGKDLQVNASCTGERGKLVRASRRAASSLSVVPDISFVNFSKDFLFALINGDFRMKYIQPA